MRVEVRLLSLLRRFAPGGAADPVALELGEGATAGDAIRALGVPPEVERVLLVNGRHAVPETPLAEGDTVTLFPPVAGG